MKLSKCDAVFVWHGKASRVSDRNGADSLSRILETAVPAAACGRQELSGHFVEVITKFVQFGEVQP